MRAKMPLESRTNKASKSTKLPAEFSNQIIEVFNEHFKKQLQGQPVLVDSLLTGNEVVVRVGYNPKGMKLRQHNFEVSLDYDQKPATNLVSSVHLAIDALANILQEHIEKPDQDFSPTWTAMTLEKREFFYRYTAENSDLEKQANDLLGIDDQEPLVKIDDTVETEEQLQEALSKLGLDGE